jgi:chemotaxis protein MotB
MLLARRDVLYLKLDHPAEVATGDLFTVYKRARKVFHPATQEYLGFIVLRLAVVRVIETDGAIATVEAITSYGQIAPGDPVMRFIPPPASDAGASLTSDIADLSGMIVELQADKPMTLVSQFDIVYVDRGSADGLKAGDLMDIHRHSVGIPVRKIGQLKVLSTEEHTATARVTKANTRVFKGDRFKLVGYSAPVVQPVEIAPTSAKVEKLDRTGGQPDAVSADLVAGKLKTQDASGQSRINLGDVASFLRYESGEAAIKPESYTVLDQVIEHLLTSGDTRLIRVEGHTDNVEIGPSLKSRYPSNIDLANARAGGVLRYLVEKGGLDSARVSAVGYGDSKPAATNANEEGRTKNRRVEILLYEPDTDPQAPTADVHNQAQKQGRDSSGLSARGTNGQLSAPQAAPLDSGAGTLSVGQQQQVSAGDGSTSPSNPNTGGAASSAGQQQPQAGEGAASSNSPNTSGAPSPNPSQQDTQQPTGPASF